MKLSHGLKLILSPLHNLTKSLNIDLCHSYFELLEAMRKAGKRGRNATLYPTDFRKVNLILETWHDVTGKSYSVEVENNDIEKALQTLQNWIREDDYLFELVDLIAA